MAQFLFGPAQITILISGGQNPNSNVGGTNLELGRILIWALTYALIFTGPFSVEKYHDALLSRYRQYGPIFKETIAGHTIVHLMDPEYIKVMYQTEGKIPYIKPLLETTQMYRKIRNLSPGLGNT